MMGADGSAPERLAQMGSQAVWSPDGRRIAFSSSRDGSPRAQNPTAWNEEIYLLALEKSVVTRITRLPGNDHWPSTWSPDGTHIAFTSDRCGGNSEIYVTDTRGSRVLNATHHPALDLFPFWHG
jgi:TolB protein